MTVSRRARRWAIVLVVLLGAALAAAYVYARQWRPDRAAYPVQGATLGAANGDIAMGRLHAAGVDFAYFDASDGARFHDANYDANRAKARAAGMRYGAVHHYELCAMASEQAANFARYVPRDQGMLPPILRLDFAGCARRPTRALVLSELTTFLAQVEAHAGLPMMLMPDADFEEAYHISAAFERSVGVIGDFREPDYAARHWALWQASDWARLDGVDGAVRWNVVYPGP
ncbi:glycoside hydrolase family 25 [Sphingorhabdus soli]|uniref:Glycoside hydrolase family 25 n=1 Tax=Flavisphingopyxis soli TaxID=2601267 RepID=A0A5C6UPB1_9SPHN|nr:GH25 family lysozyme [Sphingorhabdus soli]TXC73991.1 glycoside hydrolase family 25 [Sphingorhabdus soli]